MQLGTGVAPGKIILVGEHAVVYGRPALAVPLNEVCATAAVEQDETGKGLLIAAADLDERVTLHDPSHPLALAARLALQRLGLPEPDWRMVVRSSIPIASGLGSGAAVSAALVRALAAAAGKALPPSDVSELVYEVERLHHGTPSGIDNTVIAYGQPVYFVRGRPPEPFGIKTPFWLAIGDTGVISPTRIAVGDVRAGWQREPGRYERIFDAIGEIVEKCRQIIEDGCPHELGPLMDENQRLLAQIGVSSPQLEMLLDAARSAGALGAKLSGGGRGGNMIALVAPETATAVTGALTAAGARRVIVTQVS